MDGGEGARSLGARGGLFRTGQRMVIRSIARGFVALTEGAKRLAEEAQDLSKETVQEVQAEVRRAREEAGPSQGRATETKPARTGARRRSAAASTEAEGSGSGTGRKAGGRPAAEKKPRATGTRSAGTKRTPRKTEKKSTDDASTSGGEGGGAS